MSPEPAFVKVASPGSIASGTAKAFVHGRYEIALFNIDGAYYALENTCPHQGGPIADGFIEGANVTCPWHAWTFDIRTGKMTLGDYACVTTFDVRVEDDGIYVSTEPSEGS